MSSPKPSPDPASATLELYRARVMDHARAPKNFGKLEAATHRATGYNPLCGDKLTLELAVSGERIAQVGFEGAGCALSMASASLMTVAIDGKTQDEARALQAAVLRLLTSGEADGAEAFGEVAALASVRAFPARLKCVTLAWHTLASALAASGDTVSSE